ncbi:hypothetical protein PTKIN_Ptkin14bG0186900 [Pterospermum kingtungense]
MLSFSRLVLASIFLASRLTTLASGATLENDEVEALASIFSTLGKSTNGNLSDPCSKNVTSWEQVREKTPVADYVICDCTFNNNNTCHVDSIDLTRNYLNGTIPRQWGSMQLETISLLGNRLTGSIPGELANLSNLTELVLEHNQFSETLPRALGNLTKIERMYFSSNNFTGELPETFARLTALTEFGISDNNFTGNIPKFIFQNWTKLQKIYIEGSGLSGPIPIIDSLENLKSVIISDLNGAEATNFPRLSNLPNLENLILRSCNLVGKLPGSLVEFNKTLRTFYRDLSYNNFNDTGLSDSCQKDGGPNFFASIARTNNSGIVPCLESQSLQCQAEPKHNLSINCGGSVRTVNGSTFDGDESDREGPSTFFERSHWAFSSTGVYLENTNKSYQLPNYGLNISGDERELYINARLAPISLTHYAFCLKNATYTGKLELEDFNIMDKAGGAGKPAVIPFKATVNDGTLEIQLRWAGKGTTKIPDKGVYGPLISAIEIFDPNYKDPTQSDGGISAALVGGIVAGAVLATFLVVGIFWWFGCLRRKSRLEQELKGIELQTSSFSLRQIKAATNNFDAANKIGEGGFGPVYKGILADGTAVAVKQLSARSRQGNREFVTEIGMISGLQHPHLVKLYGCCIEGDQLLLIYEYLENNSLARALFGSEEVRLELDWPTRRKICIGIARGLAFLHEESRLKIVHRDIKATNVLLDKNLNAKISDFGLAKLDEEHNTHISTRIAGTYGYMAPEYALHGRLTDKADVYSFGIVALEIVSGKCNTKHRPNGESVYLPEWANILKVKGNILDLIDPRIGSDCNIEEAMVMIDVALLCTNPTAKVRPSMSSVVSMLEGRAAVQEFITEESSSRIELTAEAMTKWYQQIEENEDSQTKSMLADEPWTTSSTSAADLYPVN